MKYTEKEKKAIENVKIILNSNIRNPFLDDEADSIDILLNLLEKQQKEIEEKDMEMELALTGKQAEIEDNMRDIIDEYYIPIEKYNELLNSKVGVNLSYDDYISKEAIANVLNKYAHEPIEESVVINFYKELQKLLGE